MIVRIDNTYQCSVLGPYILQINPDSIEEIIYRDEVIYDITHYIISIIQTHEEDMEIRFIDTISRDIAFDNLWVSMTTPPIRENQFYKRK